VIGSIQGKILPEDFIKWHNSRYSSLRTIVHEQSQVVAARIQAFIEEVYESRGAGKIESVLGKMDKKELSLVLKRLSELASPLWYYDETSMPLPHNTVSEDSCYGVFDSEKTFLKKNADQQLAPGKTPPTFVPLLDPHRIKLFKIRAGVPLFALDGMEDMEHAYYKHRELDFGSSHIDKRWTSFPDLIPFEGKTQNLNKKLDLLRWFTLALAPSPFEIITENRGAFFLNYTKLVDNSTETKHLGSDYLEAISNLASNQSDLTAVTHKIREIFREHDKEIIKESLKSRIGEILKFKKRQDKNCLFLMVGYLESEILLLEEAVTGWDSFVTAMCQDYEQ
jgi:hypothetical protein